MVLVLHLIALMILAVTSSGSGGNDCARKGLSRHDGLSLTSSGTQVMPLHLDIVLHIYIYRKLKLPTIAH